MNNQHVEGWGVIHMYTREQAIADGQAERLEPIQRGGRVLVSPQRRLDVPDEGLLDRLDVGGVLRVAPKGGTPLAGRGGELGHDR